METLVKSTKKISCQFHQLVKRTNEGLSGPMSPVLAAKFMAEEFGLHVSNLVRVCFTDESINQALEDDYLTAHDNLIMQSILNNRTIYLFFVDEGVGYCPVFLYDTADVDSCILAPVYKKRKYVQKLSKAQGIDMINQAINSGAFKFGGHSNE